MSLVSIDWHMDDVEAVKVRPIHSGALVLEFDERLGIYVNTAKAAMFADALELAAKAIRASEVAK